jgi:hypothetical protein
MSRHELADHLISSLENEAISLEKLLRGMQESRTAWLALRPTELSDAIQRLGRLADHTIEMEAKRQAVLQELESVLGLNPGSSFRQLGSHVSSPVADRLHRVAGRAIAAAEALRRENGMGTRLLEFSRLSQEGMFNSIAGAQESHARSYDRNARAVVQPAASGSFIDGRL